MRRASTGGSEPWTARGLTDHFDISATLLDVANARHLGADYGISLRSKVESGVPPPPPNQIVHVKFAKPIEIDSTWDPIWVTGKLGIERFASEFVEAGYSMEGAGTEEYRY